MAKLRMSTLSEFQDESTRDLYLASQLREDRLALILGAGISKAFNLPDWKELISNLFADNKKDPALPPENPPPDRDAKRQVEYFRNKYYSTDLEGFIKAVKRALYKNLKDVSYETLRQRDTLVAIASLAMASRRGSASNIITFNWDDLLETFLEYHGFVTESIFEDCHWSSSADVAIFHPHGFMPFSSRGEQSESIVFDQMSYTSVMGNEGRLWRETLTAIMRCRTCILIGLSGNDDNLDMWLNECKKTHASLTEHSAFWGVTYITSREEIDSMLWKNRGIYPIVISDYERALPAALFRIPQLAASKP